MSFLRIKDPLKRNEIVQQFLKTKDRIKAQSQSSQIDNINNERQLLEFFKPVVESQKVFSENVSNSVNQLAMRPLDIPSLPQILYDDEELQFQSTPKSGTTSKSYQYGPLATSAFHKTLDRKNDLDVVFGLYTCRGDKYIGNTKVIIDNDDIIIDDDRYKGTKGLWNLITSKKPSKYTDDDLQVYAKILHRTNAMKRHNNPNANHPKSSTGKKWKDIIQPIWKDKSFQGSGTVFLSQDPNALIKRLELLMASQKAGNTGVINELVSILDELLRLKIITKEQYKNFV